MMIKAILQIFDVEKTDNNHYKIEGYLLDNISLLNKLAVVKGMTYDCYKDHADPTEHYYMNIEDMPELDIQYLTIDEIICDGKSWNILNSGYMIEMVCHSDNEIVNEDEFIYDVTEY